MKAACAALLLLAAACNTARAPKRTESQQADYDRAIKEGRILRGMKKSEVRQIRGSPQRRDRVTRMGGQVERWVYPWDEIYFDATHTVVGWEKAY